MGAVPECRRLELHRRLGLGGVPVANGRGVALHRQIVDGVLQESPLQPRLLLHEPAGPDDLLNQEARLIRGQLNLLLPLDFVDDVFECFLRERDSVGLHSLSKISVD